MYSIAFLIFCGEDDGLQPATSNVIDANSDYPDSFDYPYKQKHYPLWRLENVITQSFKKLNPISQYENTAKLGKFITDYTTAL